MKQMNQNNAESIIEVNYFNIDSSSIKDLRYRLISNKGILVVRFKTNDVYVYRSIPLNTILNLISAESIGTAFVSLIKNRNFAYKNVGNMEDISAFDMTEI